MDKKSNKYRVNSNQFKIITFYKWRFKKYLDDTVVKERTKRNNLLLISLTTCFLMI